jgi:ABC-type amino acid transport substrate-binding protein
MTCRDRQILSREGAINRYCYALCCGLLLATPGAFAATTVVIYPRSESDDDTQYLYDYELLRQALEKTRAAHGPYEMRASAAAMNQARAADEIVAGSGAVTIFARSTSIEHEARMLPIRIPIDKGLISYRVFLIRADSQPRFAAIRTLDDLRAFSVGSFITWADTRILRDGGFTVVTGDSYEGLFRMLVAQRFDFFSRGVDEAYREYDERKDLLPDLKVEEHVLLYFPTTRYFFVQRSAAGEQLAKRVEQGLNQMIKDGSFEKIFRKYKGPMIERAHLKSRRLFRIPNPYLSPETPLARRELWYDPLADR